MKNIKQHSYETPEAIILDMISEGILCESLLEKEGDWGN